MLVLTTLIFIVSTAYSTPSQTLQEKNKQIILAYYELVFKEHKPKEAAQEYISNEYIQHNPNVGNGSAPFVNYFTEYFKKYPHSQAIIYQVLADGNLVALHVNSKIDAKDRGQAIVDIYRLKNGKIVEHWDVIQSVPATTANGNTMFTGSNTQ